MPEALLIAAAIAAIVAAVIAAAEFGLMVWRRVRRKKKRR